MFAVQWVLEHTILHLLTAISDRDVAKQGCEILKEVIRGTNAAGNSKFLTNLLGEIICTLIPQATHCQPPDGAVSDNLPLDIIDILVSDVLENRQAEQIECIRGLPPFPKLPMFDKVREKMRGAAAPTKQNITDSLRVFQGLKEPVPSEVQKATLLHLHEQLREHFKESSQPLPLGTKWKNVGATKPEGGRELSNSSLSAALARKKEFTAHEWAEFGIRDLGEEDFIKAGSSYFKPSQGGRACRIDFDTCIHKLLAWKKMADAHAQGDREDIVELIGKCLGQLGPALKSAPSPPTPLERIVEKTRILNRDGGLDEFYRKYRIGLCVSIVKKLRSYLQDPNVQVVEEAIKLLKEVFHVAEKHNEKSDLLEAIAADEDGESRSRDASASKAKGRGAAAAAGQANDVRSYFEPFLNKRAASAFGGANARGAALQRNQTVQPAEPCWSTLDDDGRPRKYEEWLHALSHALCRMDQSYELWPRCQRMCELKVDFAEHIFPSLLLSRFQSSVEEDCVDEVAREMGETLAKHIFCEDSNKEAIRLVLQGLDAMRLVKQTTIKNFFASKSEDVATIRKWEYAYFFHVPYVEVAKAARRSGAHLSALMYLELHNEKWRAEAGREREGNHELLLAYRRVEEPDGLDAFNKVHDFRSRYISELASWEHHGEYAKVSFLSAPRIC